MATRLRDSTPVFCSFLLYRARPDWYALSGEERARVAEQVEEVLAASPARRRGVYSLAGFRADADLMLWHSAEDASALQDLAARLQATGLARTFDRADAYLALAKVSPYTGAHVPAFLRGVPPQRFTLVYPFVKTHDWYRLPFEDRRRMMEEHGRLGAQSPQVFTNTLYAFGLGDHEFVLAFETAAPEDFVFLLERLREVEVRRYTLRDTPLYLAARKPFWGVFRDLGVGRERATVVLEERPETVAALREGRQVAVLRRAGTKENAFGAPQDTVLVVPAAGEAADLVATVADAFDVEDPGQLETLRPMHPFVEADARERFQWRGPAQALRVLTLRAAALPQTALSPELARHGDWLEVTRGLALDGARPILTEEEFSAQRERVAAVFGGRPAGERAVIPADGEG